MDSTLTPNENKKLRIETSFGAYNRGAIQTHFVKIGEDYCELVRRYVLPVYQEGDILSVAEKIISLCQRNIIYKKDMKLTGLAKFLSKFASHSPYGVGVDNPWKMQFAIDHCGAGKIIWASIAAGVGKLFGKKGVFYKIAGPEVEGLDGFYTASFQEYWDYCIMLPKEPDEVCRRIREETGVTCMLVDANDFTRDILGKSPDLTLTDDQCKELIDDNPSGNSTQLTPFVIIRKAEQ
ncbi:MAG: F420-0--gamma-glutamyl ligase [Oscillospiraceae bacterium]|nr:F420-0--gamma-glutamyl ligase [Oscillospiraceae bacterium]